MVTKSFRHYIGAATKGFPDDKDLEFERDIDNEQGSQEWGWLTKQYIPVHQVLIRDEAVYEDAKLFLRVLRSGNFGFLSNDNQIFVIDNQEFQQYYYSFRNRLKNRQVRTLLDSVGAELGRQKCLLLFERN